MTSETKLKEQYTGCVRKRGSVKQRLTLFQKYLSDLIASYTQENYVVDEECIFELEQRLGTALALLSEYEDLQMQIELLVSDAELEVQYKERADFQSTYYMWTSKGQKILKDFKAQFQTNDDKNSVLSGHGSVDHAGNDACVTSGLKLPTIKIPDFFGTYDTWLEYRDSFESLIHTHPGLSDIHKFHYLRSSLKGDALQVIKSLDFAKNNYKRAWDLLCNRYNNTRLLINNHIKALFNLERLSLESSTKLRALSNNVVKHLTALDALGQQTDKWDTLIIHMVGLKLDNSTNRKWEEHQVGNDPPTLQNFQNFLNTRADFLESLELKQGGRQQKGYNQSRCLVGSNESENKNVQACRVCQGQHTIYNCAEFQNLSIENRYTRAKELKLCLNCLKVGHFLPKCRQKSLCNKCSRKHNTLLHYETTKVDENSTNINSSSQVALSSFSSSSVMVLLSTVSLQVFDKLGKPHTIKAILDSGSQSSYITSDLANILQLQKMSVDLKVVGLNLATTNIECQCKVKVQSHHNAFNTVLTCFVIPEITGKLPEFTFNISELAIPRHIRLADPSFNKVSKIDMLIGADCFWSLLCAAQISLGMSKPVLQKTKFGWVVSGPINIFCSGRVTHCNLSIDSDLHKQVARFWEVEEIPESRNFSREEQTCEEHFVKTVAQQEDGRFIVSLPFKNNLNLLGESKNRAVRQFEYLERKFAKDSDLKDMYTQFMIEYEQMAHMSNVTNEKEVDFAYYMPHHGVRRKDSETTKLRVVFNASSATTTGYSLNDLQLVGPTIQSDLISILLRFRQYVYVVSADIEKMYRQVLVRESERPLQRIVWRSDPSLPISIFNLNTVTYGTASAPFLAIRCLFELADKCEAKYPNAAKIIKQDFYVDDMITGSNSLEFLKQICREVSEVLESGQFSLRKWVANDQKILDGIEKSRWSSYSIKFGQDVEGVSKTLGLVWSPYSDCLSYEINITNSNSRVSKRSILSEISRIFDPLGLLSPTVIIIKIMLQELWQLKLSWDEAIPLNLHTKWVAFRTQLGCLNDLKINRVVICKNPVRIELHGFSDASEVAYGGCIYLRSLDEFGRVCVSLLCAKSKVSPVKPMTIPRLELCGALVLSQLFQIVIKSLNIKFDEYNFWCDSTIVLGWLKTEPSKLKTFVSNRVAEIQTNTYPYSWRHISTHDNPADLLSRGIMPSKLNDTFLWWCGPTWLNKTNIVVRSSDNEVDNFLDLGDLPDVKQIKQCLVVNNMVSNFPFHNYSCWNKLCRIVAYCLRFLFNSKNNVDNRLSGTLHLKEIKSARICLVKLSQNESFTEEITSLKLKGVVKEKSKLLKLSPFLHTDGTLRVKGRLEHSSYSFDKIYPLILASDHYLTKLIFCSEHLRLLHAGPQLLLSSIRESYWVISARKLARKTVSNCTKCVKVNPKPFTPPMGNLPIQRITPSPPFANTGVDYAGPLWITNRKGRGSKLSKCYVCIFICFSTKCVHIELVTDLSTEAFILTMRRFVARRGRPANIYSDNGKNFVGAKSELKELGNMLLKQANALLKSLVNEGLNWHFIPPYSPHFGGLWEAAVKSTKYHLKRVAGNAHLTFEELYTLLVQIESILNSRPLCPISPHPDDMTPLTPAHFLIGRPLTSLPDPDVREISINRLSRYQRVQQILQHFWSRWRREYLSELHHRHERNRKQDQIKIGDLVILMDENLPPLQWKLGRISEVHPGTDGVVRVVSIQTSTGITKRAVRKVCPLMTEIPDDEN